MLVKVKHKETGKEALITPRAYDLAKKRYIHLGTVADNNANVSGATIQQETEAEAPKPTPQTPNHPVREKESGAAPAVSNPVVNQPTAQRRKPGPKSKKEISSPITTDEV